MLDGASPRSEYASSRPAAQVLSRFHERTRRSGSLRLYKKSPWQKIHFVNRRVGLKESQSKIGRSAGPILLPK
jgi:hypothetical protein